MEIANRLQVDQPLVARWGTGERVPTATQRKLLRDQFGIAAGAWHEPAKSPPPTAFISTPLTVASFWAETQRLYDETRRLREHGERYREDGDVRMYLKFLREASVQQTLLGRLLGVTEQISEERVLRMPAFRRLVDRILTAVTPFPKALRAIIETLEVLDEDARGPT